MELENGQEIEKSGWGGARAGSGRPVKYPDEQVSRKMRRKFNEYITEDQIKIIVSSAIDSAIDGKVEMQKFVLEQVFGKALQQTELSGADGSQLVFAIAKEIVDKNDLNTEENAQSS